MGKSRANIELILANIIFGVSYSIIVRLLEIRFSYEVIFVLQIFISALIIIPCALLNPHRRQLSVHDLIPIATCGIITIYGWSMLTLRGMTTATAIDVASLSTFGPTVTIIAATISSAWCSSRSSHRRHLTQRQVRAIILPFIALIVISMMIMRDMPHLATLQSIKNNIPIIMAVVCMGVSTVIITEHHERYGTLTILAIYFTVAIMLLPMTIDTNSVIPQIISLKPSVWLLLFPLITMTLPLYLLYRGALQLTPLHTALYRYIQPIISLVVIMFQSRRGGDWGITSSLVGNLLVTLLLTLLVLLLSTSLIPKRLIK